MQCRHSLVPSLRSKYKNLIITQENLTKSAIQVFIKILLYLTSYKISLNIFYEGLWVTLAFEFYLNSKLIFLSLWPTGKEVLKYSVS